VRFPAKGSPNVVIAVIDSGIDENHPALQGRLLHRETNDDWNFVLDDEVRPLEGSGHGTLIAGLLVGEDNNRGIHGICPACRILPLKIPMNGHPESYQRRADAIRYALTRVPAGMRLILNLSWSTGHDIPEIQNAVNDAASRDALVVASAGNTLFGSPAQRDTPHYPSDYPNVISVTSVDRNQQRPIDAYFGDNIDISAPGGKDAPTDRISSAQPILPPDEVPAGDPNTGVTDRYGTSYAAPHVTGIAALIASAAPHLTAAEIRHAIESTASQLPNPDGMGRGLVNADAALQSALQLPRP
jgi:subtilisin family serine protease